MVVSLISMWCGRVGRGCLMWYAAGLCRTWCAAVGVTMVAMSFTTMTTKTKMTTTITPQPTSKSEYDETKNRFTANDGHSRGGTTVHMDESGSGLYESYRSQDSDGWMDGWGEWRKDEMVIMSTFPSISHSLSISCYIFMLQCYKPLQRFLLTQALISLSLCLNAVFLLAI